MYRLQFNIRQDILPSGLPDISILTGKIAIFD
jgi:hypothetical protein